MKASSEDNRPKTPKPNDRRRSKRVHRAVLDATSQLLEKQGYAALTVDAIAAKAGVGKQTIYRWWPNKACVALEAFADKTCQTVQTQVTGSLHADLVAYLQSWFAVMRGPAGATLRALIAQVQLDADFGRHFRDDYLPVRQHFVLDLLREAVTRGDLPTSPSVGVINDLLFGPVWYRLTIGHGHLDDLFADQIVTNVIGGLKQVASKRSSNKRNER